MLVRTIVSHPGLRVGVGARLLPSIVRGGVGSSARLDLTSIRRLPPHNNRRHGYDRPFSSGVVQVPIAQARETTAAALRQIGWDEQDAALQAEIMTAAELCGNNQGLVKMYQPELMAPNPASGKPVVERETRTSAVINGNQAPGMLAAVMAADLAVKKLEEDRSNGPIAIVCTHNTSTSSGQLAFYVDRIARKGYIGIAMCNSPEFVAAAKGAKPVFGTNPLAVGIPQKGSYPFTVSRRLAVILVSGTYLPCFLLDNFFNSLPFNLSSTWPHRQSRCLAY